MNAMKMELPDNVVPFQLPKRKPKVIQKESEPYQKSYCITPWRAAFDRNLHEGTLRVLMVLCSYTNRAGITWVGQTKIGVHLGISKQAVSKQMKILEKQGYIQVVSKGWKGERANTTRVIFDETVTTEDAIAITSTIEDTRPPYLIKKEQDEMTKDIESKLTTLPKLSEMSKPKRTTIKPTDSITVKQMKETINKKMDADEARAKRLKTTKKDVVKHVDNSQLSVDNSVDNLSNSQPHSQPDSQPLGVDQLVNNKVIDSNIYINNNKELSNKLLNIYKYKVNKLFMIERIVNEQDSLIMIELVNAGLTESLWNDVVDDILTTMKAKRQEPPHRIGYFRDGILRALA